MGLCSKTGSGGCAQEQQASVEGGNTTAGPYLPVGVGEARRPGAWGGGEAAQATRTRSGARGPATWAPSPALTENGRNNCLPTSARHDLTSSPEFILATRDLACLYAAVPGGKPKTTRLLVTDQAGHVVAARSVIDAEGESRAFGREKNTFFRSEFCEENK